LRPARAGDGVEAVRVSVSSKLEQELRGSKLCGQKKTGQPQ